MPGELQRERALRAVNGLAVQGNLGRSEAIRFVNALAVDQPHFLALTAARSLRCGNDMTARSAGRKRSVRSVRTRTLPAGGGG